MKKSIISLALMCMVILLGSCKKTLDETSTSPTKIRKTVLRTDGRISFEDAARMHNEILRSVTDNLTGNSSEPYNTVEERAYSLSLEYVANNYSDLNLEEFRNGFAVRPTVFGGDLDEIVHKDWSVYADNQVSKLLEAGAIEQREGDGLNDLFRFIQTAKANHYSTSELQEGINSRIETFNAAGYDTENGQGVILGYCLYVAKGSDELWSDIIHNNHGFEGYSEDAPVAWVAADVAGALGGAVGSALDNVFHGKKIDWASVGAWAIGGAVGCSCLGPISKVISWLL